MEIEEGSRRLSYYTLKEAFTIQHTPACNILTECCSQTRENYFDDISS